MGYGIFGQKITGIRDIKTPPNGASTVVSPGISGLCGGLVVWCVTLGGVMLTLTAISVSVSDFSCEGRGASVNFDL